jgi:RimJ/RimL family protein N-acetyltransferase
MTILIPTERESVVLRQLEPIDAAPLSDLIGRNQLHLSQFGDDTAQKYPDYESVLRSIEHARDPSRLRFGIWDGDTLVGSANLTPWPVDHSLVALGYWTGTEFTRRGYAVTAAKALCRYAFDMLRCRCVVAYTHLANRPSQGVLRAAGFDRAGSMPCNDGSSLARFRLDAQ